MNHNYFIYIITNKNKTVLYIGVTNDLYTRISQHTENIELKVNTFAAKYKCKYLLYYERFSDINHAIDREKEIKKWRRSKKEDLINTLNPEWNFLNDQI